MQLHNRWTNNQNVVALVLVFRAPSTAGAPSRGLVWGKYHSKNFILWAGQLPSGTCVSYGTQCMKTGTYFCTNKYCWHAETIRLIRSSTVPSLASIRREPEYSVLGHPTLIADRRIAWPMRSLEPTHMLWVGIKPDASGMILLMSYLYRKLASLTTLLVGCACGLRNHYKVLSTSK
jgi:hypothetical protein